MRGHVDARAGDGNRRFAGKARLVLRELCQLLRAALHGHGQVQVRAEPRQEVPGRRRRGRNRRARSVERFGKRLKAPSHFLLRQLCQMANLFESPWDVRVPAGDKDARSHHDGDVLLQLQHLLINHSFREVHIVRNV
ncbi:MAG: hypothetical protein BJ554DRAFT_6806 [Olpidium bornovanus]|uniref:Uncharacterized protein n=1 Tax=Olpidium bornovanus TaxID=278681 RepID=A0A8H7ZXI3_9FUNG|nr:MAG: hypothetical protein BJ554DRAFT_6806 [Olpidium bornovanus]